jgi:hypothetical protein
VLFERIWNKKISHENVSTEENSKESKVPLPIIDITPVVPFSTKTLSQLREFFLSRRSVAAFLICGLLAAAGTYGLHQYNLNLSVKRIQERVLSIAATGTLQFDPIDLNELRTHADMEKPEYKKVVYQLNEIRRQNEGVAYAYLMRPGEQKGTTYYIADADGLDPDVRRDINFDGEVNEMDSPTLPGDLYEDRGSVPEIENAYKAPVAFAPYVDANWGEILSGWAPIKDGSGKTVAIFGVDVFVDQVFELTGTTSTPILFFVGLFIFFIFIRLAAFNRSLFRELIEILLNRKVLIIISISALLAILITYVIYAYTYSLNLERMQDKALAIATTASLQQNVDNINQLQEQNDYTKPEWGRVVNLLEDIRTSNANIKYIYIFRKSKNDSGSLEFVADAQSMNPFANIDNDPTNDIDINEDGIIEGGPDEGDLLSWPGQPYPNPPETAFESFNGPLASDFYEDQWGKVLTGYAPIKNKSGEVIAMLAVDIDASQVSALNAKTFAPIYTFIILFFLFTIFRISAIKTTLLSLKFFYQQLSGIKGSRK